MRNLVNKIDHERLLSGMLFMVYGAAVGGIFGYPRAGAVAGLALCIATGVR